MDNIIIFILIICFCCCYSLLGCSSYYFLSNNKGNSSTNNQGNSSINNQGNSSINNQGNSLSNNQEISQQSTIIQPPTTSTTPIPMLYPFKTHTFTTAGKIGREGPTLAEVKTAYSNVDWAQNSEFLNMTKQGIQEWKVPVTGNYKIQAIGAGVAYNNNHTSNDMNKFQKGMNITMTTTLTKGEVIKILVGQSPLQSSVANSDSCGGAGGTFVVANAEGLYRNGKKDGVFVDGYAIIVVAGGGGGRGYFSAAENSNASNNQPGRNGEGNSSTYPSGIGGVNLGGGGGGNGSVVGSGSLNAVGGGGGGFEGNGANGSHAMGGTSFINGGVGGQGVAPFISGGFGGGGGGGNGGGGGGFSGGGNGGKNGELWSSGGGGGSYSITGKVESAVANNNDNGSVTITFMK
jgi:hypothetical protein